MALLTKVGTFVKPTVTGSQAITGVGFVPKVIMFWTCGSVYGTGSWGSHFYATIGFTTGPANSFCTAATGSDSSATTATDRRMAAKAISAGTGASTVSHDADLTSFDADGFTLNWTLAGGSAHNINYLALGGSDITGAKVVNWQLPIVTGNKAVTGVGFQPDLVLHSSTFNSNALPSISGAAYLLLGAMNKHGQQWSNSFSSQNAVNPSNASRYQQTDASLAMGDVNETLFAEAHYDSMNADGFTTNFSTAPGANAAQMMSLCIQGVSSKIGAMQRPVQASPFNSNVRRTGFTPKAVLTTNIRGASAAASAAMGAWGIGCTDGSTQRSAELMDNDAISPTLTRATHRTDAAFYAGHNTLDYAVGSASVVPDGFDVSWTAGSDGIEFLYLALGSAGTNTYPTRLR